MRNYLKGQLGVMLCISKKGVQVEVWDGMIVLLPIAGIGTFIRVV